MIRALLLSLIGVSADQLSDYVAAPDANYNWFEESDKGFKTLWGNTARILNVTSQQWMDETKAQAPGGAIWTHTAIVIIPKQLTSKNISTVYLTGNCNGNHQGGLDKKSEDVIVVDELAHNTGSIAVAVQQIPNCPIVFPGDPLKKERKEDAILAMAWRSFIDDPEHDISWIPRLPMVKAAFQVMRAVQEFSIQEGILDEDPGWVVSGASKRGWTAFLSGAVNCTTCPAKIIAIAPLVPIVPDIVADVHRQWQSMNGFTFAFEDYTAENLTTEIDGDVMAEMWKIADPINYIDQLATIPKYVVVSSNDEFMSMDWTNLWWDQMKGEKHLLIKPNSEHSMATAIYQCLSSMGTFVRSIAAGKTERPSFTHQYNPETGELSVTIPRDQEQPEKVMLRHSETLTTLRRDFRWAVQKGSDTQPECKFPYIDLALFGDDHGLCAQPIFWKSIELFQSGENENGDSVYTTMPPEPIDGFWTGYYVEVVFPGDTESRKLFKNAYITTTPGYTWPNTLPYDDCFGETCIANLV